MRVGKVSVLINSSLSIPERCTCSTSAAPPFSATPKLPTAPARCAGRALAPCNASGRATSGSSTLRSLSELQATSTANPAAAATRAGVSQRSRNEFLYRMWLSQWLKVGSEVDRKACGPVARRRQRQEIRRAEVRARSGVDLRIKALVIRPGFEVSPRDTQRHRVAQRPGHRFG